MTVIRRVQSISKSGYFHPSGERVGQSFEIEKVQEYEQFHEERFKTESSENISPKQWLEIMAEKSRQIKGSKLVELDLPSVDIYVEVYVNTFEVFDATTKKMINKVNFYDEANIESGEMLGNQKGFKITTSINEELQYSFEILKPISKLKTDVMNLIGLFYNQQDNFGYYFGSFELGQFTINYETGQLEVLKKYTEITHAYSYLLTSGGNILIGFQNGYLQYINWTYDLISIWHSTEASPSSINSLTESEQYFIAGLNDGSIKLFDKKTGKLEKSHQVAELTITHLVAFDNLILAGNEDGRKVYCFDIDREIHSWEISLAKGKFISFVKENDDRCIIYTERGYKLTIDKNSGSIREHNFGHELTSSPSKIGPWELLGSKNKLLFGTNISPSMRQLDHEYSRISSVIAVKGGVLVSSIDGQIEFLKKVLMKKL